MAANRTAVARVVPVAVAACRIADLSVERAASSRSCWGICTVKVASNCDRQKPLCTMLGRVAIFVESKMTGWFNVLIVGGLVAANGFFVAAEFALVKVRLAQIQLLVEDGSWRARWAQHVLGRLDAYLSACQVGITLASLGLGWVGEPFVATALVALFGRWGFDEAQAHYISLPLAFALITFLHITLGEQAPKILAVQKSHATTLAVVPPLVVFYLVFRPVILVINGFSNLMLRLLGVRLLDGREQAHSEEELRLILAESAAGGSLTLGERIIMENVLNLEDKRARQVMVPRSDIVYLSTTRSLEENFRIVAESGHTRFPLCEGDLDHVIGMVHAKSLLQRIIARRPPTTIRELAQEVRFFPENIRLDALLREFLRGRQHMAMLVDEYGVISGLVTFEDVLEQLVGPIYDEFDREQPPIVETAPGRYTIDALCPVESLAEKCQVPLPEVEADTVGGMISELLGHIAKEGEAVRLGPYELRVVNADSRRVRRLELVAIEDQSKPSEDEGIEDAQTSYPM
ncbi:MAG: membrane protein [Pirellulaceae bacterium]|nr:MAG: membrane protein [Pirellulaceae bacterium]